VRPRTQIPVCTCTRVYICVCVCAYTSPNVCSARNDRSTGSREWLSNKAFLPPRGVCIANCLPPSIFLFAVILMPAHIPAAPSPPPPPSMDRGRNVGVFARGESRNYLAVGPTAIQDPRRSSRSRAASSLSLSLSLSLSSPSLPFAGRERSRDYGRAIVQLTISVEDARLPSPSPLSPPPPLPLRDAQREIYARP